MRSGCPPRTLQRTPPVTWCRLGAPRRAAEYIPVPCRSRRTPVSSLPAVVLQVPLPGLEVEGLAALAVVVHRAASMV